MTSVLNRVDAVARRENARRLLLGLALATFSAATLSACNTVEGAGEDIESAGEAIQDGADND